MTNSIVKNDSKDKEKKREKSSTKGINKVSVSRCNSHKHHDNNIDQTHSRNSSGFAGFGAPVPGPPHCSGLQLPSNSSGQTEVKSV